MAMIRISEAAHERLQAQAQREGRTIRAVVDRWQGVGTAEVAAELREAVAEVAAPAVKATTRARPKAERLRSTAPVAGSPVTEQEASARTVVRDTTSVALASLSDEELRALERRLPDQRPTVTRQRPELLPVGPGADHRGPTTPVLTVARTWPELAPDPMGRLCARCQHTFRAHGVRGCYGTCTCSLKHFKEPHA